MCVALPGKVVEVIDNIAVVDFSGNKVRAEAGIVDVKVGDFVLVHAGLIIQVLGEKEAKDLFDIFAELNEVSEDMKNNA